MKLIKQFTLLMMLALGTASANAMSIWVVESGQNPFSNSQGILELSSGLNSLDLYYDMQGDISYGYDFILDIVGGSGSIANVGGGDAGLGDVYGSGWRQFGGDIYGETGNSVFGFTFDFTADEGTQLLVSGSYTDASFSDATISSSVLATVPVSAVPVPAALWLFASGLVGLVGAARRKAHA